MSVPLVAEFGGSYMSAPLLQIWMILHESPPCCRYSGSYMSAHVLLNSLKDFGKSDKMRGLWSILLLFRNDFDKFNNTRDRMLDSIYHMTLKSHFLCKTKSFFSSCTPRCYGRHNVSRTSCMALFYSHARRRMINMM